jgi:hypothetical protein
VKKLQIHSVLEPYPKKMSNSIDKDNELRHPLVADNEHDDSDIPQRQPLLTQKHRKSLVIAAALVLGLFFFGSTTFSIGILRGTASSQASSSNTASTTNPQILHCGSTPDEARALGCVFQIWSYSWVPKPCSDPELIEDFLALRDWEYYDDKFKQGRKYNLSEILTGNHEDAWGTWGQHYYHCAFTWLNWVKIQAGSGIRPTSQDVLYEHAVHCTDVIAKREHERPWGEVDTKLKLGYFIC